MSNLVVFDFDGIHTADQVPNKLRSPEKEYPIDSEDARAVERDKGAKVHIKQAVNLAGFGAATGGMRGAPCGELWSVFFSSSIRLPGWPSGGLPEPVSQPRQGR